MKTDKAMTVKDLLDYLVECTRQNPKMLNYQIARSEYDDFSCSYTHFTYACESAEFIKLPKSGGSYGVDCDLTTQKILLIN